jgi:acetyl esterase/lipase
MGMKKALQITALVLVAACLLAGCGGAGESAPSSSLSVPKSEAATSADVALAAEIPELHSSVQGKGYTLVQDVAYGALSKAQAIDIALLEKPVANEDGLLLAVVFIHGGSWRNGDKEEYLPRCTAIAKEGAVAATLNYRMLDENANCEDMLADVNAALWNLLTVAREHNLRLDGVVLMGPSAGGHLALLYAYKYGSYAPVNIVLCVAQSAPADFTAEDMYEDENYGPLMVENAARLTGKPITEINRDSFKGSLSYISPLHYVSQEAPPTILAHGVQDFYVPCAGAQNLHRSLRQHGVQAQLFTYPNSGHGLESDPSVNAKFFAAVEKACGIDVSPR